MGLGQTTSTDNTQHTDIETYRLVKSVIGMGAFRELCMGAFKDFGDTQFKEQPRSVN